ncbi:hypothetical protein [Rhizomonospora bruguierae]|uniref:hypothetical protein n=1 Tax=Rhizomonospora bruguierae TaxID=1581705 RepID=UPI001BD00B18|nr:hypothetical protein [Micromonospora sp. NBRC 107566]
MSTQVDTPPELAGGTFESTLRSQAAKLKAELIRQTLADVESWVKAMQHEYERLHPDRPNDRVIADGSGWVYRSDQYSSGEARIPDSEIAAYETAIRTQYYEWVIPAFERYLLPDPDALNPTIDALRTIESSFGGSQDDAQNYQTSRLALTRINDVRSDMGHWAGDFQVNFIDNFLTPLQNTVVNQAAAAKMAREVLGLNKLAYIAQRKAILQLLDSSIKALGELSKDKSPSAHTWATLIGITAGTVLTGFGVTAWVGIALISASTIAQGLSPDPKTETNLAAPTAQEIAVKIADALSAQSNAVREDEDTVMAMLNTLQSGISNSRTKLGELAVPKPNLATATPADVTGGHFRPAH